MRFADIEFPSYKNGLRWSFAHAVSKKLGLSNFYDLDTDQFVSMERTEILKLKGIGKKTLEVVEEVLSLHGIFFEPPPPIFSAAELAKAHDEYEARLDQAMVMDKPQGFGPSIRLNTEQPPRDEWTICRELVALLRELRNASKSQVLFENLVQSVSEKVMST